MKYDKTKKGITMRKVFLRRMSWDAGISHNRVCCFGRYEYKRKYSLLRIWKVSFRRSKDWNGVPDET